MEPSRVLFPAQLAIQRLLDSYAVASTLVFFCFRRLTLFFHERHDMPRFLPEVVYVNSCDSAHPPSVFPIIRHDSADGFRHPRHLRLPHYRMTQSTFRTDLQARTHHSHICDMATSMNSDLFGSSLLF